MSSEVSIAVRNVTKRYLLYDRPIDRLKQLLSFNRKTYYREFTALEHCSFEVRRGHTTGIIGQNGSGKSTLLQLVCGTLTPTAGTLAVNGRISALLELGSGFNPEFTGRENVMMQGAIMGLSRAQMIDRLPAIEAFADIGRFLDQPMKSYSSGMFVRLAFATAVHIEPDILVVDEALSVGDIAFQHKCMTRMREFMRHGTVLFVSHDLAAITALCDEVIWLEHGRIREIGEPKTVTEHYWAKMYEEINKDRKKGGGGDPHRSRGGWRRALQPIACSGSVVRHAGCRGGGAFHLRRTAQAQGGGVRRAGRLCRDYGACESHHRTADHRPGPQGS